MNKKINKPLYFSICISGLCIFFAVLSFILACELKKEEKIPKTTVQNRQEISDSNLQTTKNTEKYLAENISSKKIDCYFAISRGTDVVLYVIYENGEKEFKGTTGISTITMRKKDKENFKDGIVLKTHEDVLHLIEDYTS